MLLASDNRLVAEAAAGVDVPLCTGVEAADETLPDGSETSHTPRTR